jgi:uncharacterized protein YegJ (DUF2314 family)
VRWRRPTAWLILGLVGAVHGSCGAPKPPQKTEFGVGGVVLPRVEGPCERVTGSYALRKPDDNVRPVEVDDPEMLQARSQAQKTLGYFLSRLKHPGETRDHRIKARFAEEEIAEHMWVSGLSFDGERFTGVLDNTPKDLKTFKADQRVAVEGDKVEDWLLVDGETLMGAYTLRYFLRRMTKASCQKTLSAFRVSRLGPWSLPAGE